MRKTADKPFNDWQAEEVEKTFGITRLDTLPILEYFTTLHLADNHQERPTIEAYRKEALWRIEAWNEDEYKFLFISPFLKLLDLNDNGVYTIFAQRPISIAYDNGTKTTTGKVELMFARGRQNPKEPRFFFAPITTENGFPRFRGDGRRADDPLGQLLIAMVAAYQINKDEKPIYGVYVNGRNWFFVAFTGTTYAVSNTYGITTNGIFDLFAILEHLYSEMDKMYGVTTV